MTEDEFEAQRATANAAEKRKYVAGGHALRARENLTARVHLNVRCKAEGRVPTRAELDSVTDYTATPLTAGGQQ